MCVFVRWIGAGHGAGPAHAARGAGDPVGVDSADRMATRFFRLRAAGSPPRVDDALGQELVRRWRRGEEAAFAEIFRSYRGLVFGVLAHLMPRDPELEDVVQQAFVEVFRSLHAFEGRSKLSSWIARVALHVGYHHLRRKKSRPGEYGGDAGLPELVDESASSDPESVLERREAVRRVYAILETIAPKKRTVFILNDLQGLPQEEVAEVVGASAATVRTRLFYARKEFWKKAEKDPVLARLAGDPQRDARLSRVAPAATIEDADEGHG